MGDDAAAAQKAATAGSTCAICSRSFESDSALANHLKVHLTGGSYTGGSQRVLTKRKQDTGSRKPQQASEAAAEQKIHANRGLAAQSGGFNFATVLGLFSSLRCRFRVGNSAVDVLRTMMGDFVGRIKTVVIDTLSRNPVTSLSELGHLIDRVSLTTERAGWPDQLQTSDLEAAVRRK